MTRDDGLAKLSLELDKYHHYGLVPKPYKKERMPAVPSPRVKSSMRANPVFTELIPLEGSCSVDAEKPKEAAPAKRPRESRTDPKDLIDKWLADTGCGNDLVGEREVAKVTHLYKEAAKTITFITANGETKTRTVIPLKVSKLGEM